ncbi:DUF6240 domain-containing protein [Alkaliphilus peptidifermentans]|uniref:Hook-length control protein FliK n=1 Tax=Alkaliphilus peptidifermentans DSM 18978 TaxID=1120976 RepID=A0A1G5IGH4_9FIRM|nr:DUF6240 domain-containing protein [Alkaliphilus peptidifermentans]SCY74498.1 hypothetical protein SAMN03080606_02376 [Alkaliphilus peptidifermentans DSM 18978]
MNNGINNQVYHRINQAYGSTGFTLKIRGTIVSNNGLDIKIDIGNQRILDMKLNQEIKGRAGDIVTIDKKNILTSKLIQENTSSMFQEEDKYVKILKAFNLPEKSEYFKSIHALENHGIDINKDNILAFITAKNHLDTIIEGLDYDSAIQLLEKDVDVEKDPLSTVSKAIDDSKETNKGFSLAKIVKSFSKMTTEDAEGIAQKIYGSKMGKDITDIIKALNQAGMEISKKNIDRVNNVFDKLHTIKSIEDEKLVDIVKNKIEASIDNLYKVKKTITKGRLEIEEKINYYAAKVYEGFRPSKGLSEKDLRMMEDDIRSKLHDEGIEGTKENIQLSKLMIKSNLPIAKESLDKVLSLKAAINQLAIELDQNKIAHLLGRGINVDKEEINQLIKYLNEVNQADLQVLSTSGNINQDEVNKIIEKLAKLSKINDEELLLLIKGNGDIKLSQILLGKEKNNDELLSKESANVKETYHSTIGIINIFSEMKTIDYNTIAFHLNRSIPNTLENLYKNKGIMIDKNIAEESLLKSETDIVRAGLNPTNSKDIQLVKALMNNGLSIDKLNIQSLYRTENYYNNLRNNMNISMIKEGTAEGIQLEKLELGQLNAYVQDKITANSYSYLTEIGNQKESIISLLMKNNIPQNLSGVQNISMLLYNKQQLAHQLDDLFRLSKEFENSSLQKEIQELQKSLEGLTKEIKAGNTDVNKFYDDFINNIKNLSYKAEEINPKFKKEVEKQLEKITNSLQLQGQLNKNDILLQLPIMMNDKLNNLQIYVMNKKKNSKKIDPNNMSILLNIDTDSMEDINVYVGVVAKKAIIKIGVKQWEYKRAIDAEIKQLERLMETAGYEVKEISYKVDENQHLLGMIKEIEMQETSRHSIDIII